MWYHGSFLLLLSFLFFFFSVRCCLNFLQVVWTIWENSVFTLQTNMVQFDPGPRPPLSVGINFGPWVQTGCFPMNLSHLLFWFGLKWKVRKAGPSKLPSDKLGTSNKQRQGERKSRYTNHCIPNVQTMHHSNFHSDVLKNYVNPWAEDINKRFFQSNQWYKVRSVG